MLTSNARNINYIDIAPQPGPQTAFLESPADIIFYGGQAGGGKTFGLCLDKLKYIDNPKYKGIIFRSQKEDIRKPGGLWDESINIFSKIKGARSRETFLDWKFPSGAYLRIAHINDFDLDNWRGSQLATIDYDEIDLFSDSLFWFMFSRNRSTSGIKPKIKGTCNPSQGWLLNLIRWWINKDGFANKDRSGKLRWLIRDKGELIIRNTYQELREACPHINPFLPKSFTFIPSSVRDNKILMEKDPAYISNLMQLNEFERARFLDGNWFATPKAGTYFKRGWVEIVDCEPADCVSDWRAWDRAATKPNPSNPNPDWTAGTRLKQAQNGLVFVKHVERFRDTPNVVEQTIKNTASQDSRKTHIALSQDPGSAGKTEAFYITNKLHGFIVQVFPAINNKLTNFKPFSSQAQAGNIKLVKGAWNEAYLNELESFTGSDNDVDDQVDATSLAYNAMIQSRSPSLRVIG